jgi:hypothetical protein
VSSAAHTETGGIDFIRAIFAQDGPFKGRSVTCCNSDRRAETHGFPRVFSGVLPKPGDTVAKLHRLGESSRAAAVDNVRSRHRSLLIVANCN